MFKYPHGIACLWRNHISTQYIAFIKHCEDFQRMLHVEMWVIDIFLTPAAAVAKTIEGGIFSHITVGGGEM